jgi:GTP diphosphokinase / guanosine-3',5'-bis(diphosphate) 3'-diphosphatase
MVSSYSGANAEPILTTAYGIAFDAHEGFLRHDGEPFINHPFAVANILAEWFAPPPVVAAGLLHDVLNAKYSQGEGLPYFQGKLEPEVFHLLEATSSLNSFFRRFEDDFGRGTNENLEVDFGREINANVILHEAPLFVQERDAFIIKIADQLHNLQTISNATRERQKRVAYFALNIFAPLADRLGMGVVKRQLEDDSFRIINPAQYDFLQHQCGDAGLELQKNGIVNQLQEELTPLMLKIEVRWSPFSLYAIYHRQLEKQARYSHLLHEGLIKLEDSGSFIVMTEDELDCFHLLRRLHKLYPPVDHQLRDLIYHRNPNGYQSLHT